MKYSSLLFILVIVNCNGDSPTPLLDAIIKGAEKLRTQVKGVGSFIDKIRHKGGNKGDYSVEQIDLNDEQLAQLNQAMDMKNESDEDAKTIIVIVGNEECGYYGSGNHYGPPHHGPPHHGPPHHGPPHHGPPHHGPPHHGPPHHGPPHHGPPHHGPPHYGPPDHGPPHYGPPHGPPPHGPPPHGPPPHGPPNNRPGYPNRPGYGYDRPSGHEQWKDDYNTPDNEHGQNNVNGQNNANLNHHDQNNSDKNNIHNHGTLEPENKPDFDGVHGGKKPNDGGHKHENKPTDQPSYVPLNPNEYVYGGDKIEINGPKRDTNTGEKEVKDDEEFPIDIRFNTE